MTSNLDQYNEKKERGNEIKRTPFDSNIKKKDDFKLVKIDPQIHGELKLAALKDNTTMQKMADLAIKKYLSERN
ncbi:MULTISPECIES: hypothetical protein [Staphylococcus]|uniref:hypothetical protein n=1 Tax=Staphylococcus TaxID=1279 RepID=UPI001954D21E|nr:MULTISPECIES: hypothetical protein [Staphylococcus]MCT2553862.1 hypothetical protein [Staphylococcus aureus]MCT2569004.1 hypothetical protein [Staphylococcus aureus]MCT2572842.1 hypothetical protein [Staphylococcus aureus]MCT2575573.1 hypothetical protein [Staphylococcus aureus]MEA1227479.1 hypothetical protein [Staphylococcus aureus]